MWDKLLSSAKEFTVLNWNEQLCLFSPMLEWHRGHFSMIWMIYKVTVRLNVYAYSITKLNGMQLQKVHAFDYFEVVLVGCLSIVQKHTNIICFKLKIAKAKSWFCKYDVAPQVLLSVKIWNRLMHVARRVTVLLQTIWSFFSICKLCCSWMAESV